MIKTLSKHIKGYVRDSVITPLFMILEVIMETIVPFVMSSMIDDGINKGDMNHILLTGSIMALCWDCSAAQWAVFSEQEPRQDLPKT